MRVTRNIHFEDVPAELGAAFIFREFSWQRFPFNWHYHPEVELTLIVRGSGVRFVGDSAEEFQDGDLCLLGANTPHCWASHARSPRGVRSLVIQFLPDAWGAEFWELPELRNVRTLLNRATLGLAIQGTTRRIVGKALLGMTRLPRGSVQRLAKLLEILSVIAETKAEECQPLAASGYHQARGNDADRKLGRVLEFIHANLGPDLTEQQVAAVAGMSPASFSQFFKRRLRKTYVAYVNELKVRSACRSLIETDHPITELAFAAGFNNLSHFNEQFRRLRGVSPRTYRMQARDGVIPSDSTPPADWLGAIK
jgi:AraC-like DNA-binding protein